MAKMVIPSVFTAIDKFSGPMDKMGRKSDAVFARMERKARKVSQVSGDISRKSAIAATAVIGGISAVTKQAIEFESSLSNVNTLIDENVESIDKIGESILSLSEKLPVPIEELTESLYSVRSAGIAADKQFNVLESSARLSVAGLSTVSEATNIQTAAFNAFAREGKTANEISNILFKTVKAGKTDIAQLAVGFGDVAPAAVAANVSIAELSAATAALTVSGAMKTTSAQNKLKALFDETTRSTGKLAKAYSKLNKGNIANRVSSDGYMSVLEDLKKSVGGNEIAFKNMFSSQEAGAAALVLLGTGNESYTKTLKDMESGTDALTVAFDKQAKTGKAQGKIMMNQLKSLSIQAGKVFIPIMQDLIKTIGPYLKRFSEWAKQNKEMVSRIAKFAAGLGAFLVVLAGVSKMVSIVSGLTKLWRVGTIALNGVVKAAKTAQLGWNAAMSANPIGLIIAAVAALGFALYKTIKIMNRGTDSQRAMSELMKKVNDETIDQRVEVRLLFDALRNAEQGTSQYNQTLKRLEEIQPGITKQYDLQIKAINKINEAEKQLTQSIKLRAMAQGATELITEKTKELIRLQEEGTEGWDSFNAASGNVLNFLSTGGTSLFHDDNSKLPFGGESEEVARLTGEKQGEIDALTDMLRKVQGRQGVEEQRQSGNDVFEGAGFLPEIPDVRNGSNNNSGGEVNINVTNSTDSKIEFSGDFSGMPQMQTTSQ